MLVAHNENDSAQAFAVQEGRPRFTYTLPGDSLATFVWRGDLGQHSLLRQVNPAGWTATASPSGPADPCCSGDVDFGSAIRARQVVFDTGASTGGYPRGYSGQTSVNGTDWTTVVPAGPGTGQFTIVDLPGYAIQYVRITLTAAAP